MGDQVHLHQTALEVIRALKSLPDFSNVRIAVIGGLARMHYNPNGRCTKDVDFIIDTNSPNLAARMKKAIVGLGDTDFRQRMGLFYRKVKIADGSAKKYQVYFIESDLCGYLPCVLI